MPSTVETLPPGALYLALERPETFSVAVNGQPASTDVECGWWVDRSLRKLPIDPATLRIGRNELTLVCDYSELHSGLEIAYLLGEFGTRVKGTTLTLTAAPRRLALGDWVKQGLAFYCGSVGYTKTIRPRLGAGQRLFVQVPAYEGVAVRILVDGQPAGIIAWEPKELDITDCLRGKRLARADGGGAGPPPQLARPAAPELPSDLVRAGGVSSPAGPGDRWLRPGGLRADAGPSLGGAKVDARDATGRGGPVRQATVATARAEVELWPMSE